MTAWFPFKIFVELIIESYIWNIQVAHDDDLREQIGKDIYFDLVDHDKVHNFRIQKQMPFVQFKVLSAHQEGYMFYYFYLLFIVQWIKWLIYKLIDILYYYNVIS